MKSLFVLAVAVAVVTCSLPNWLFM
jgi:hypothetical protein